MYSIGNFLNLNKKKKYEIPQILDTVIDITYFEFYA